MKLVKLLGGTLAACALVSTAQAGQWTEGSIAGFDHAFTYVPDTYAPRAADGSTDKRSLVIHLIGCGQIAEQGKTAGGWEMAAEAYGMIVVIPDPMKPVHPNKAATKVECFDYGYNSDFSTNTLPTKSYKDHAAIIAAPAKMKQAYSEIDLDQVYVTGLSAGATVAMEVACMAPDVFAGVGEAAGPAWDTRQQQAVAAVGGGGMVSKQTDPAEMKNTCKSWAGSNLAKMKEQVWAIVSDDSFLPIGGLASVNGQYTFSIFNDGSVWDGDKFTPTVYHEYVVEVMQDLMLSNAGTKTEEVITSSEEHGQGSGCSAEAADFEWNGLTDGAYGVDYSSVQCLPKDYVRRDWEAKAEIWESTTGHKQLVRIQQDTLKHSWPIGTGNRAAFMECTGPNTYGKADITVDQLYNPANPDYSYMKNSDGMWNISVVETLPNGAIGCIYFNPVSINFPMYLGKLWNNNNPKLGAAITDEPCEDLNKNGICDDEELCEDLNDNGICDDEEQCEDLNDNGICDDEELCEDLNNNGICDDEELCADLNDNGCDVVGPELEPLQISVEDDLTVVIQGKVTIGDAELTSATLNVATSAGISYGPFALDIQADGTFIIALGGLPEDTYKATVNVEDANDVADTEEKSFTVGVIDNIAPVIGSIKAAVQGEDCVVFSGTATDADGSVTGVDLRIKGVGTKAAQVSGTSFTYDLCGLEAGTYSATAIATDNGGLVSEKSSSAAATIEGSSEGGEAETQTGTFYAHWSAGRITGSMWAPTAQYTEMKNKYCATSWYTMFCTTQITMNKCPEDTEWTDAEVACGGGGITVKKADLAAQGGDIGTVNVNTAFVIQPTVANNGPDAAGAVSLEIAIPAGITVDAGAISGDCEVTGSTIECALGTIANGSEKSIAIPATSSVQGGYIVALSASTAQKDENAGNNASEISVVVGKIEVDEEAPIVSSITLSPADEVEEGKTVKVSVVASDNKGVTSGTVKDVSGSTLCALSLKSGTATAGTLECSFTAPEVAADAMLSVDATVADAAGNTAESDLAQITVINVIVDDWTPPAAKAFHAVSNYGENSKNENGQKHTSGIKMYLHIPADLPKNAPIVMAMHGCQQTASGFRTDTGWTDLADKYKFYVIFPEMKKGYTSISSSDHSGNDYGCFNWAGFYGHSFARDIGDSASLIQMIRYVRDSEAYQGGDIYVTGLSAGGGMTAAMGAFYPDEIKAIAPMSGPTFGCATFNPNGSETTDGQVTKDAAFACQGINSSFSPLGGCESGVACMQSSKKRDADMWAQHVTDMGPANYSGAYPKTLIWSGTKDQLVDPIHVTNHAEQWTITHGTSMTATNTVKTIKSGGRQHVFNEYSKDGEPVVATVMIQNMGHGIATDPGSAEDQGGAGSTSDCYGLFCQWKTDVDIHSSYYTAKWWGLID